MSNPIFHNNIKLLFHISISDCYDILTPRSAVFWYVLFEIALFVFKFSDRFVYLSVVSCTIQEYFGHIAVVLQILYSVPTAFKQEGEINFPNLL